MILIFGIELLKKYLKKFPKTNVCFYDDWVKEYVDPVYGKVPYLDSLDTIDRVIFSDSFSNHTLFLECVEKKIVCESELSLFLNKNQEGIKVGIVGNNYKSCISCLCEYIFNGLCFVSHKIGKSPLEIEKNTIYFFEITNQLSKFLTKQDYEKFDFIMITDSKEDFHLNESVATAKCLFFYNKDLKFDLPENYLFEEFRYQVAWNLIAQFAQYSYYNVEHIKQKLQSYCYPQYNKEVVHEFPLIINDSNATNISLLLSSLSFMKKDFVLICNDFLVDIDSLKKIINIDLLKKVFLLSKKEEKFLQFEYSFNDDFELLVKEAYDFALKNKYTLLFSPGGESFGYFSNYQERGKKFNSIIEKLIQGLEKKSL